MSLNNTPVTPKDEAKNYYLAAGYVFFHPQGKPEETNSAFVNAVFAQDSVLLPASSLGQAQRALMQRIQDQAEGPVEVVAVEFSGITHLGLMKPSEFHNIPAPKAGE